MWSFTMVLCLVFKYKSEDKLGKTILKFRVLLLSCQNIIMKKVHKINVYNGIFSYILVIHENNFPITIAWKHIQPYKEIIVKYRFEKVKTTSADSKLSYVFNIKWTI